MRPSWTVGAGTFAGRLACTGPDRFALDQAREAARAARRRLSDLGLSRRARDPQGYAAAQQTRHIAEAAEAQAYSAYSTAITNALAGSLLVRLTRM